MTDGPLRSPNLVTGGGKKPVSKCKSPYRFTVFIAFHSNLMKVPGGQFWVSNVRSPKAEIIQMILRQVGKT